MRLGEAVVGCNLGGMVKGFVGWQELTTWKTHLGNLLMLLVSLNLSRDWDFIPPGWECGSHGLA